MRHPAPDPVEAFADDAFDGEHAPVRQYVGLVMRHLRIQAGLTQAQLGEKINYADSLIAHIEAGRRSANLPYLQRLETATPSGGLLTAADRLLAAIDHTTTRRAHPELEHDAAALHYWSPFTVTDFLQTEDYTRALRRHQLPALNKEQTEQALDIHRRQHAQLLGPERPTITAVLDETALRRHIGGAAIMREQLSWLLEWIEQPRVTLQILPLDDAHYPALTRPTVIAEAGRKQTVAYVEGHDATTLVYKPDHVQPFTQHYANLRGYALSPEASARLIQELTQKLE